MYYTIWTLEGKLQVINCILHIENNAKWSFSTSLSFFRGLGGRPSKLIVVKGPNECAPVCVASNPPPQPEKRRGRQEGSHLRRWAVMGADGKGL